MIIAVLLVLFGRSGPLEHRAQVYAWGVLVATIVQFLIPLPLLRGSRDRAGIPARLREPARAADPAR